MSASKRGSLAFRNRDRVQADLADLRNPILNALPAHISLLDREGNIIAVNEPWRAFAERNGYSGGGTGLGRNYLDICQGAAAEGEEDAALAGRGIAGILAGQLPIFKLDYPCHAPEERRWFRLVVAPLRGTITAAIVLHYDITEQKLAHEALDQAKTAAEAACHAKSEFVANISHEIRTPLHGLIGMIDLTLETGLTGEQRHFLMTARSAGEMLLRLINDVLDFSRIEAGQLSLEPKDLSLRATFEDTLEPLRPMASRKGLRLQMQIDPEVPDALVGDAGRIRQILTNVVNNAIKFTEKGEVSVRVHREKLNKEDVRLRVSVSDTGIGIQPDKLKVIFQPFVQVDGSTTRAHEGSGLGLTIAAQLIELMGGRIWAESRPGRGSTFRFTLRLQAAGEREQPAPPPPAEPEPAPLERPLRILLVDDSRFNQLFTTTLLAKRGHRVFVAKNGRGAVELAAREHLDLILMDVQMPEMDGIQATAAIRAQERAWGRHVPILAMTARAMEEDREACLRAGMDSYISKPVRPEDLMRAIAALSPSAPAAADGGPPPPVVLDWEALLAQAGGDTQLLRRMAKIFADESDRLLKDLRAAVGWGDALAVEEAAHALKGILGHWGRGRAFDRARRLEEQARIGDSAKSQDVEDLDREIHGLKKELQRLLLEDER
jgi:signal transduction histidine kinase/DNA-binding response OmpR family regulator